MLCRILLMTIYLFSGQMIATEVDSFTARTPLLKDASMELNRVMNDYFLTAIRKANQKNSCDPWVFMHEIAKVGGGKFFARVENDLAKDESLDKRYTSRKNSVYREFNFAEAPGIFLTKLAHLIRVDNVYIGVDKLGHFLDSGFSYFKRFYKSHKSLKNVLEYGEFSERTYYGLRGTGIYSYADLAANFDGFRFYQRLSGFNKDINDAPYVSCFANTWSMITPFDIKDYLNPAWDEAINRSRFKTNKMHDKLNHQLELLKNDKNTDVNFAPTRELCEAMINRYGDVAQSVINPDCFKMVDNTNNHVD